MKTRVSLILAALLTGSALAVPAQAAPTPLVDAQDPKGDVKMLEPGLTKAERKSIDIRRFTITKKGAKYRFAVRLRAITTSDDFDQMVFIRLKPKGGGTESGDIGFSPQSPSSALGYAYVTDTNTAEVSGNCDPLVAKSNPSARTAYLDVPAECVPSGTVKIRVTTITGFFRSDGSGYSKDVLVVPGLHDLTS